MSDENKKYGIIGTSVFHIILLLILIFFGLKTLPQGEEGILVNFGDTVMGQGTVEPKESQAPKTEKTTPPPPAESKPEPSEPEPVKDNIQTQDYDDAPVVKTEAEKKKEREEKERIERERKEREEQERIKKEEEERQRQEELERQRKEEEERKKQEEQDRQAAEARNKVLGAFSGKGSGESTSEGETGGSGNQGSITGDPNSRNRNGSGLGNSGSGFDLTGRSLIGGLPKPTYNIQEEGIVVVEITVDKNGIVTNAQLSLRGTTTMNNELRNSAIAAAKKAKFNVDKEAAAYQKGTITYKFVLD